MMAGVKRRAAAIGSALFFLVGPGLEAGVGPWLLTGFERGADWPAPLRVLGVVLIVAGLAVVVTAFVRFASEGLGTPAPVAPAARLVVGGPYRHVRNPMYVATAAVIVGEGLVLGQPVLLVAAVVYGGALALLVRLHEEPVMAERFGASYDAYRRAVPAWIPRLRPWSG
jgi:protein-S-isoprenylcysteine O-methyltransferase Ste14